MSNRIVCESFADYLRAHVLRSPAHAREAHLHPPDQTDAQRLGQAIHCAVLEPREFRRRYAEPPVVAEPCGPTDNTKGGRASKQTKAGKAAWAAWEAAHPEAEAMEPDEWRACHWIAEAAAEHPVLGAMLAAPGKRELSVYWADEETGASCKARVDLMCSWGGAWVVDLKSTQGDGVQNGTEQAFSRALDVYGYDMQAAWYLDGLSAVAPFERRFCWAALEAERPVWPAYGNEIRYIDAPAYRVRERERVKELVA
jgi:hypothetical protein